MSKLTEKELGLPWKPGPTRGTAVNKPQDYEYWNAVVNFSESDDFMHQMRDDCWEVLSANGVLYQDGVLAVYTLLRRLRPEVPNA